jgi:hypothetical protein
VKLKKLFRPVGVKELELIKETGMKAYPPRFSWQPIFYPVLNFEYAAQIAKEWNTEDESSGFAGFVTEFEIMEEYFLTFKVENVGGKIYKELWIPSKQLHEFNENIVNGIRVVAGFYGDKFSGERSYES